MGWFQGEGSVNGGNRNGLGSTGQPGLEPQENSQGNTEASTHASCLPEQTDLLVHVSKLSREGNGTFLTFLNFVEEQGQFAL